MKIRHADGRELEVTDETFTDVYQAQGFEAVDESPNLDGMTRDELNAHAASLGIDDPESQPNKAALIDAIQGTESAQAPAADDQTTGDAASG